MASYPPGATFGPRTLRDYELAWIIEGRAEWRCDGEIFSLEEGGVILCRPRMVDSIRWDAHRTTRHGFIHFDADLARMAVRLPPASEWPIARQVSPRHVVRPLLEHLEWLLGHRPPHWRWLAESALQHVLALLREVVCKFASSSKERSGSVTTRRGRRDSRYGREHRPTVPASFAVRSGRGRRPRRVVTLPRLGCNEMPIWIQLLAVELGPGSRSRAGAPATSRTMPRPRWSA